MTHLEIAEYLTSKHEDMTLACKYNAMVVAEAQNNSIAAAWQMHQCDPNRNQQCTFEQFAAIMAPKITA